MKKNLLAAFCLFLAYIALRPIINSSKTRVREVGKKILVQDADWNGITAFESRDAVTGDLKITISNGLALSLPARWKVLPKTQTKQIDELVKNSGPLAPNKLILAANYYDPEGRLTGMVNLRMYQLLLDEAHVRDATPGDLANYDQDFKSRSGLLGANLLSWMPTKKARLNGANAFFTEYRRRTKDGTGVFRVQTYKVFAGDKSFTIQISVLENSPTLPKMRVDRIISSIGYS